MMGGISSDRGIGRADDGVAAVEFAIMAPVFLAMLFGAIYLSMLAFNFVGLHNAVEDAARCAAVKKTVCTDAATTAAYAQDRFMGFEISPTFTYAAANCGSEVTGTATFAVNAVLYTFPVSLSATACYPS